MSRKHRSTTRNPDKALERRLKERARHRRNRENRQRARAAGRSK